MYNSVVIVYVVILGLELINSAITIWMGLDQSKYKEANGFLWTLVNVFLPFGGWIGYLINRKSVKKARLNITQPN